MGHFASGGGLYLLFPVGKRPDTSAFENFEKAHHNTAITHISVGRRLAASNQTTASANEAVAVSHASSDLDWIEVLRDGLTYELYGLAPGDASPFPALEIPFDMPALPAQDAHEAIRIVPGQHLSGGANTSPVIRGMVALARDMILHFAETTCAAWTPARTAIGKRYFESISTAWLEGGAFPALGLTAFEATSDGALHSVGLGFWIGQELRIEPALAQDKVIATRLGIRLINQLIATGGLDESERMLAPDGSRLVLRPSRNGDFIRVSPD